MTVKELKDFLDTCKQDIQVVIVEQSSDGYGVIHGINSVEQVKPFSFHDEPEYDDVVEIAIM